MNAGDQLVYGSITETIEQTYIVAYKENTDALTSALASEGLEAETVRKNYSTEEQQYSPIIKCMLTHMDCWRRCLDSQGVCLIVEADFVPVIDFGGYFLPYDLRNKTRAFGYLYTCGPQFYDIDEFGFARGHAGGLVAYLITSSTAKMLLEFGQQLLSDHDPRKYFPFDAKIGFYLQEKGVQSYIPYRMYGEHGGVPNKEHKQAGLSKTHRADTLASALHFLPAYADGSWYKFLLTRCYARIHGVGRLLCLKYLAKRDLARAESKIRVLKFAIFRHISLR